MLEPIRELNMRYLEHLEQNGPRSAIRQLETLNRFLVDRHCTFRDEPMPTLLKPNFISARQSSTLVEAVETMSRALNKFIGLYLENSRVRDIMKFPDRENELFFIEPGYSTPLVISRLDAFQSGYALKFLEFNCDSPAGIAYSDVQEEGFRELFREYPFLGNWDIEYFRRQDLLLSSLLECYAEFRKGHPSMPQRPVIAIVDWKDVSTYSEFLMHKTHFSARGFDTVISAPQEITLSGEKAYTGNREIHLIYRRVITRELVHKWSEVQGFIEVIKRGLVCCCNSFRSYIVGNKKILSIIKDPRFQDIFEEDERKLIRETIPWTAILADTTALFGGREVKLREFTLRNRERLVLKPANMYGGRNVFIGQDTPPQKWQDVMEEHIHDESWILQQYVDIPRDRYPEIGTGLKIREKYVNINPYALLEKYCGTITRVSDNPVINVSAGGGLVPTLKAGRKNVPGPGPGI